MSENTIKVEIYNQTYNIRSEGDNEYIHRLAEHVDRKMREVTSGTHTVDSQKVAVLAALHIADELYQVREQGMQVDAQLAARSSECVGELDRLLRGRQPESNGL